MFRDRTHAGRELGRALLHYQKEHPLVLAVPKGGLEVGYQVARALNTRFSIVISRKLPFPDNPESGFGAIAEDGSIFLIKNAAGWVSKEEIEDIIREQQQEILRRIQVLRNNEPLPGIKGKTVILVDDGIAMGSTMRATIQLCKNKQAKKIIVAAPVASPSMARRIGRIVDDIVILEQPPLFRAVAQVYEYWYDVSDQEAISLLKKAEETSRSATRISGDWKRP